MKRMYVLVAVLGMVAAACGESGTETTIEAPDTTAAAQASAQPFCDAAIQGEMVSTAGPEIDFESATEEEIGAAMGDFAGRLEPLLADLEANAPDEVKESVDTITALLREGLETGEPVFDRPEFREADAAIDGYVLANCEVEQVAVTAVDYEFQGVPETLAAGTVALDFTNGGNEVHEMVLLRVNDGVTESISELLELPEEEAMQKVEFAGAAFAGPGSGDITFVDLTAGDYAVVCFVPLGTTDIADFAGEEEGAEPSGPPHFTQGMVAEFTVEG